MSKKSDFTSKTLPHFVGSNLSKFDEISNPRDNRERLLNISDPFSTLSNKKKSRYRNFLPFWSREADHLENIPTTLKNPNNNNNRLDYSDFPLLNFFIHIFFLFEPNTTFSRSISVIGKMLILAIILSENVAALMFTYPDSYSMIEGILRCIRLFVAFVSLIYLFYTPFLIDLLSLNPSTLELDKGILKRTKPLVNKYFLALIVIAILEAFAGIVPLLDSFTNPSNTKEIVIFVLSIVSRLTSSIIWALSLTVFFLSTSLLVRAWHEYIVCLKNSRFSSIESALVAHAKLTEITSEMNREFQVYLAMVLAAIIAAILSSLYNSLQVHSLTIKFVLNVFYLFAVCTPGSYITSLTRKVKKYVNWMRVLTDPNDPSSIQDVDSFLIYLLTNGVSFKIWGVAIDLGFTTKLAMFVFSLSAFMIQRELSNS